MRPADRRLALLALALPALVLAWGPAEAALRWLPLGVLAAWCSLGFALRGLGLRPGWTAALSLLLALAMVAGLEQAARASLEGRRHPLARLAAPDPVRLWRLRPNLDQRLEGPWRVTSSAQGFRGRREYGPRLPGGPVRVAAVGDSWTFGWGVDDEDTWTARLEGLLQRKWGRPVEVVNAGVFGYCAWQAGSALRERVLPLQPDVVIVSRCRNDEKLGFFMREEASPVRDALRRTHLYLWTRHQFLARVPDPQPGQTDLSPREIAEFEVDTLRSMVRSCRDSGAMAVLLDVQEFPASECREAARREAAPLVVADLRGTEWRLPFDPVHCDAPTHARIAETLAARLPPP